MTIHIESLHLEENREFTKEINEKIEHLGKKYPMIHQTNIVLRKEKSDVQKNCFVSAKVAIPGRMLFASEGQSDFRTAFDKVLQDLENQLKKTKELMQEKR